MCRLCCFLLLLVLAGCVNDASPPAEAQAREEYRYRQAGSGEPIVVFENGLGVTLETWEAVQEGLDGFTTSFAYSRAGYSGSPQAVGIRDAATAVANESARCFRVACINAVP
jgi:hypothetical protein